MWSNWKNNQDHRPLWNDERILIGKRVIHWKGWQRAGITKDTDLISLRGGFMGRDMIEETYGIKYYFLKVI